MTWLALALFLYFGPKDKSATDSTASVPAKPAISREEARASHVASLSTITAGQLASAYDSNTVAADELFKGREYKVSGTVVSINTDFRGRPYVTMQGGVNSFMEPQFAFENAKDPAIAQLRKGTRVTLACTGNGDVAKTPMSKDCQLLR